MARSITVQYYVNEGTQYEQGYPLRIVATASIGMPREIFVLQRHVESAMNKEHNSLDDMFVKIAEPNALEEYPVEPPDAGENSYYRVAEILLYFRSMDELEETRDLIATCIQDLVDALKLQDNLALMMEVTYD